jgi:hypothetical protein
MRVQLAGDEFCQPLIYWLSQSDRRCCGYQVPNAFAERLFTATGNRRINTKGFDPNWMKVQWQVTSSGVRRA